MNKNFYYKKTLGQNFLVDKNIINKIIDDVKHSSYDMIIEIGPGSGALTSELKKLNIPLFAFEIDKRLESELSKLEDDNTKIIFSDFLSISLKDFLKDKGCSNLLIIGNIPYYITTPIVKKVTSESNAKDVILMVQNEVALRYASKQCSKSYGSISVYVQYNYDVKEIAFVNKKCFYPVPKVDSSVIKLSRKNNNIINEDKFYSFIKEAFSHKRKTLKNNLVNYDFGFIYNNYLKNNNFSETCRAEELSVQDYINIFNLIN